MNHPRYPLLTLLLLIVLAEVLQVQARSAEAAAAQPTEVRLETAPLDKVIEALNLKEKVKLLSSNGYVQRVKLGNFMP